MTRRPALTLVTAPGCYLCEDARSALEKLARERPVALTVIDTGSEEGRALESEHRPALRPLVLLDGSFFSAGRLPRRKLRRALEARAG